VTAQNDQVPFVDLGAMTREVRPELDEGWAKVLETGRFVGGQLVEEFEATWAAFCGTNHAIGVANGTDALRLTLTALGIGPGDEVIVPTNTFVATAAAVVLAGATPRFADVNPDSLLLGVEDLSAAISPRTRAVIVVHLYGQVPDMTALCQAARGAGIALIEDAAQAHGAAWHGAKAGSLGLAGCFSFYPAKNLGAFGDAGAVVTSDPALAARIRMLRDHGREPGSHYRHAMIGTNSRLDALQAMVLSAKVPRLESWTKARQSVAACYRAALEGGPASFVDELPGSAGVHHLAVIRVSHRDEVQRELAELGIATQIHYPIPCHQQKPYRRYATESLPVAERTAHEILSLPMFPHMTQDQVARVCEAVQQVTRTREHTVG
jgi:dTDP-4-amino-4,6-dideoxygalactose transaminase